MAVPDQEREQASDVGKPRRRPLAWREALGVLPPVLAVVAVLLYGYLSIAYDQFYRRLGVDLSDVGLSYTGVLARSSGFVVAYLLGVALLVGLVATSRLHVDQRRRLDSAKAARDARLLGAVTAAVALLLAATLVFPWWMQATPPARRKWASPSALCGSEGTSARSRSFPSSPSAQTSRPSSPPANRGTPRRPIGFVGVTFSTSASPTARWPSTIPPSSRPSMCRPPRSSFACSTATASSRRNCLIAGSGAPSWSRRIPRVQGRSSRWPCTLRDWTGIRGRRVDNKHGQAASPQVDWTSPPGTYRTCRVHGQAGRGRVVSPGPRRARPRRTAASGPGRP
jgi:hypothetical protein